LAFVKEVEELGMLHLASGNNSAVLALLAEHTQRPMIGPTVTNPQARNPIVAAQEWSFVQWLSGGRAFFGLGSGGGQDRDGLLMMGSKPSNIADIREYGQAVKDICAGRPAQWHGHTLVNPSPMWIFHAVRLYLDVSGPKTARFVGEIAD